MSNRKPESPISKALEFAIFSNNPVHAYLDASDKHAVRLRITDVHTDSFETEPSMEIPEFLRKRLYENQKLRMSLEFKRQIFVFEANRVKGSPDRLVFQKPEMAALNNRREFPRFELRRPGSEFSAELTVEGTGEKMVSHTTYMGDISPRAISFYLNREDGVVLPGDDVTHLKLTHKGIVVLESRGKILRVNTSDHHARPSQYLAVVGLENSHLNVVEGQFDKERRRATRAYLLEQKSAFVHSVHPLCDNYEIKGPIVDISKSGVSFLAMVSKAPVVSGMMIPKLEIQLPMYPRETAAVRVISCKEITDGEDQHVRVQCKFESISSSLLKSISQVIQNQIQPNVEDATSEDYDQLWEFLFETGFIYGDKRKQIQEYAAKTFGTYRKLLKGNSPIVKKILFKDKAKESIRGHISSIRFFDNAWLIQHLNALKSSDAASAAQGVLAAITEFFKDHTANKMDGHNFVTCYYRPDNLYPMIVFGEAKKFINNPEICDTRDFAFCLLSETLQTAPQEADGALTVREATKADLIQLEDYLIAHRYYKELRVEGLTAKGATNLAVSTAFEAMGLYRRRRVFVCSNEKTGDKLFAVCNYASPGLNLSELTNSIRLFGDGGDQAAQLQLSNRVLQDVLASYQSTELTRPTLLLEAHQATPAQYTRSKVYRHWILNTAHVPLFKAACDQTFANIRELVQQYMIDNAKAAG